MGTELATFRTSGPPLADPHLRQVLAIYMNKLEVLGSHTSISDRHAPTHADLALLRARRNDLAESLSVAAPSQIAMLVGELFLGFPSVKMDAALAKKTTASYVTALQHLPRWAIEKGCTECRNRDCPFPPSAGELRAACERAAHATWDEHSNIRKVLEAEVYHEPSDGERARVKAGFDNLLKDLSANSSLGRRQRRPDARDPQPAEPERDTRPLPKLSEEAMATFRAKQPDTGEME